MKKSGFLLYASTCLLLWSCNNNKAKTPDPVTPSTPVVEKVPERFFPVTSFIRGQILDIAKRGINPLRKITQGGKVDSSWLKTEEMNTALADFLSPVIDTTNLVGLFTETRFEDQTIGSYTFTYAATGKLPDTMTLRRWDVYINPETEKVKRIYIEKEITVNAQRKTQLLTWNTDKDCKVVTVSEAAGGGTSIEKEVFITWDF